MTSSAAASWDAEYACGRYAAEPPVAFTRDIIDTAAGLNLRHGLYIGCGNGRNLVPMLDAGLALTGLDISEQAVAQLRARRPGQVPLVTGDLSAVSPSARFGLVIGIQVFQHGNRAQAHRHMAAAAAHVRPGGLLCVRVNAAGTDIRHDHERTEQHRDGGFTVRYRSGPKTGLEIHFFSAAELTALAGPRFRPILPLRVQCTPHLPPAAGQWSQWEVIWQAHTVPPDQGSGPPLTRPAYPPGVRSGSSSTPLATRSATA
jgi:SAM-dependent methyltransferase